MGFSKSSPTTPTRIQPVKISPSLMNRLQFTVHFRQSVTAIFREDLLTGMLSAFIISGTLVIVTTLCGTMLSGIYQDVYGRRRCLLVSLLPQVSSWIILYNAKNVYWLYAHALAVGAGAAFCEHVVVTYVSEIASVEMRGRLFSIGKFGYGTGAFLTFLLGNFYDWRTMSLVLLVLPALLPIYLFFVSEFILSIRFSNVGRNGQSDNILIRVYYSYLKARSGCCPRNAIKSVARV